MNRNDAIRMAREAGLNEDDGVWYSRSDVDADVTTDDLERFANLIATHEREEYALICDADLIAAHEREECARICDELDRRWVNQAEKCAELIRARSK